MAAMVTDRLSRSMLTGTPSMSSGVQLRTGRRCWHVHSAQVQCSASKNGASSSNSDGNNSNHSYSGSSRAAQRQRGKRARMPGLFEVRVVTPPPRSLGIYALPPLTHNGEEIEVDGQGYVVTSVSIQMKLNKGRYVRDHSRLDVQPTPRYFTNMMLDSLLKAKYVGKVDTGKQD